MVSDPRRKKLLLCKKIFEFIWGEKTLRAVGVSLLQVSILLEAPPFSYERELYRIALRPSLCCTIHPLAVFPSWWLLSSSGVFGLYFLCSLFRPPPLRASVSFATSEKLGRSIPLPCGRVFFYAVRKCVQLGAPPSGVPPPV